MSASSKLWRSSSRVIRRSLTHRPGGRGSWGALGQSWRGICCSILPDQRERTTNHSFVVMPSYASKRMFRYWRWLPFSSYIARTCYRKLRVRCQPDRFHGRLNVPLSGAIQMATKPPGSIQTRPSRRKEARSFSSSHSWYLAQPSPGAWRMSATGDTPPSRGSWSSLFNTGGVRQFMAGAQNSPDTGSPGATGAGLSGRLPVPGATKPKEPSRASSQSPLKRGVAKSWSESSPRAQRNPSAVGTRPTTLPEAPSTEKAEKPPNNKKIVVSVVPRDTNRWETTDL